MKILIKNNYLVIAFYLAFVLVGLYFISIYSKVQIHIYINQWVGNPVKDLFFKYITLIGDGWFVPFFILIMALLNIRLAITCLISFSVAVLITLILKFVFFDDVVRPWYTFQWTVHEKIKYVNGVKLYLYNSFPSGHSTQAFALLIPFMFYLKNYFLKYLILIISILAAFSRTYLSMHWLEDVIVGSLVGFIIAFLSFGFIVYTNKLSKLNVSLVNFKKQKINAN
ncbi:MAG: phosphatase PAP2 family protein [Bacteroidetes bacterium]|nr:phosphatase PAP2 family protein [Bacteroidota bacterium]